MFPHEYARRARVVEVNVAEEEMPDVCETQAALAEACLQRLDAGSRAAVEQRRPVVGFDQVGADDPVASEVVEVERPVDAHARILGARGPGVPPTCASATYASSGLAVSPQRALAARGRIRPASSRAVRRGIA